MGDRSWPLKDAKTPFSARVAAALDGRPQRVTRRGKAAVVVVSADEYVRLQNGLRVAAPSFTDHPLAMPRAGKAAGAERGNLVLREAAFD